MALVLDVRFATDFNQLPIHQRLDVFRIGIRPLEELPRLTSWNLDEFEPYATRKEFDEKAKADGLMGAGFGLIRVFNQDTTEVLHCTMLQYRLGPLDDIRSLCIEVLKSMVSLGFPRKTFWENMVSVAQSPPSLAGLGLIEVLVWEARKLPLDVRELRTTEVRTQPNNDCQ